MQIIGSFQIVTNVTSVVSTFFSCIALFDLFLLLGFTVNFALFVRMRWGISLLRERFKVAPRPLKNPLASWAQLDQLMGSAWYLRPRRKRFLQLTAKLKPPPPKKNKKARTEFYRFRQFIGSYYFQSVISAEVIKSHWIYHSKRCKLPA